MDEEEVHIAVGKEEEANILWSAANFPRATIVLVHVHWPSELMPFMGGKVSHKSADEMEKKLHRAREKEAMVRMLLQYKSLCCTRKVRAHYLEHDDILAGVVKLIKLLKIKRIIIGPRDKSVQLLLHTGCQVWLVDNGKHISTSYSHLEHTRSTGDGGNPEFELDDQSDGYTTAPSDLETRTLTEENLEETIAYQEEVEILEEQIQICRNVTKEAEKQRIRAQIDILERELEAIQGEDHNYRGRRSLSLKQTDASLKEKSSSNPIHSELQIPEHIAQFSMSSIVKATKNFYSRIGEGSYGAVYEGKVGGIPVAIKLLKPDGRRGYTEYKQEIGASCFWNLQVAVLSKTKHLHIVRLIGVCPESCGLVYEYLPNGTLMDGLSSKGLSWEDRVRILAEQRSALAYLHCSRPHAIIHGDVKPSNILLDACNVSRLGDFGTARVVHVKPLEEGTIICRLTNPMGTLGYMDPVFMKTGELTTESDMYSFGVVILNMLTGQVDVNMVDVKERVRKAVKANAVHRVLDASAGSWPWPKKHARGLLRLALRCCSMKRERRPAITAGEWRRLDNLQAMANRSSAA